MPSFFTPGFGAWLALVLLLVAGAAFGVEEWRIGNRDTTITTQETQLKLDTANLAVCDANMATLKSTIDQQNAAIKALADQNAALAKKLADDARAAVAARAARPAITGSGPTIMNKWFQHEYGGGNAP